MKGTRESEDLFRDFQVDSDGLRKFLNKIVMLTSIHIMQCLSLYIYILYNADMPA